MVTLRNLLDFEYWYSIKVPKQELYLAAVAVWSVSMM
jgi:hypothetical protein